MAILSNNFSFLNRQHFPNKEKIIEEICDCEKRAKSGDFTQILNTVRTILDCVLDNIISMCSINSPLNSSTYEKTKAIISEYGESLESWENLAFKNCRVLGNVGSHTLGTPEEIDAIYQLKNIQMVFKTYFKKFLNVNDNFPVFDHKIYANGGLVTPVLPMVTPNDLSHIEKSRLTVQPDLNINKMQISRFLAKNFEFIIPIYQRKYSWNEGNIKTLIDDIDKRVKDQNSHFFGTISAKILIPTSANDFNQIKIIDGQQRLTTSMLLFCAIREIISDIYKIDYRQETLLKNVLRFDSCKPLSSFFVNPGGNEVSNTCFRKILDNKVNEISDDGKRKSYYVNYKYMVDEIGKRTKNLQELRNFLSTYINNFVVGIIDFDANTFKNKKEMEIFQNINSKGSPLLPYDLMKNYLLNLCDEHTINNLETKVILAYNSAIESRWSGGKVEEIVEFFDSFIHYFTGKNIQLTTDKNERQTEGVAKLHALKEALANYDTRTTIEKGLNIEEFKEMIDDIGTYLQIWNDVKKAREGKSEFIQKLGVSKIFTYDQPAKKNNCFYSLTFLYFDLTGIRKKLNYFNLNEADRKKAFDYFLTIYKALIKETIIFELGKSDFNNACYKLSRDLHEKMDELNSVEKCVYFMKEEFQKIIPSNLDIRTKLDANQKDWWFHKPILEFIEWELNGKSDGGETVYEKRTLEHFMPVNNGKWMADIMKWNNIDDKAMATNKHTKYLNKIGNYLLLTKSLNCKIKDESFEIKKMKISEKILSPLYKWHENALDISRKETWTFEMIDIRSAYLLDIICEKIFTF